MISVALKRHRNRIEIEACRCINILQCSHPEFRMCLHVNWKPFFSSKIKMSRNFVDVQINSSQLTPIWKRFLFFVYNFSLNFEGCMMSSLWYVQKKAFDTIKNILKSYSISFQGHTTWSWTIKGILEGVTLSVDTRHVYFL